MFTGLIEEIGVIRGIQTHSLHIGCTHIQKQLSVGDSVAVQGVCLTVVTFDSHHIEAEVMPITLKTTTLGMLHRGMRVHLERALRLGDRVGGHIVSGHVDAIATIVRSTDEGDARLVTIKLPPHLLPFVIEKGSIAIDGISLTIATITRDQITVSLVGHTKTHTTLETKNIADVVNIECDQIGKYLYRFMNIPKQNKTIDASMLQEHGFLW